MGERKTIYVQDGLWGKLTKEAELRNISISQLILNPWIDGESQSPTGTQDRLSDIQECLAKIESKLDLLIPKGMPVSLTDGRRDLSPQDKLDKERSKKGSIKKAAIARGSEAKDNKILSGSQERLEQIRAERGGSGGYSKDKQLGKKGKS